ncbi:hypothetical protein MTO96_002143 [Rhipicephalus appendiculatus]
MEMATRSDGVPESATTSLSAKDTLRNCRRMWSNDAVEELISLVRERPALYDPSHRDYSDQVLKPRIWDEIGRKLGFTGDECKKKWQYLRDKFTKEVKKVRTNPWIFFDMLKFLRGIVARRFDRNQPAPEQESDC